ncbi:MAG: BMC domain-containing protein [Candidatus Omnitrophica bacterium]|nr:BMC domain-containing protein [Candidatus Omnitrophota bacterium]
MKALGLIETRGLISAIEAADAAVKAAETVLAQIEYTVPALVTVKLRGEVADVKSAVEAGAAAARKVGEVVSAHVIPSPHEDVEKIIIHTPEATMTGPDARGGESQKSPGNPVKEEKIEKPITKTSPKKK